MFNRLVIRSLIQWLFIVGLSTLILFLRTLLFAELSIRYNFSARIWAMLVNSFVTKLLCPEFLVLAHGLVLVALWLCFHRICLSSFWRKYFLWTLRLVFIGMPMDYCILWLIFLWVTLDVGIFRNSFSFRRVLLGCLSKLIHIEFIRVTFLNFHFINLYVFVNQILSLWLYNVWSMRPSASHRVLVARWNCVVRGVCSTDTSMSRLIWNDADFEVPTLRARRPLCKACKLRAGLAFYDRIQSINMAIVVHNPTLLALKAIREVCLIVTSLAFQLLKLFLPLFFFLLPLFLLF